MLERPKFLITLYMCVCIYAWEYVRMYVQCMCTLAGQVHSRNSQLEVLCMHAIL